VRFDYPAREMAYSRIKADVERRGYRAQILGLGGTSDALVLAVDNFSDYARSFVIHKRERGWFLRLADPVYYAIATDDAVMPLCIRLLTSLELTVQSKQHALTQQLSVAHDLVGIPSDLWYQAECLEKQTEWGRHGWTPLPLENEEITWGFFEDWYHKRVRVVDRLILGYAHCQMWDLARLEDLSDETKESIESDLTLKFLAALNRCSPNGFPLYALDRNHPTYLFDPRLGKPVANRNHWAVPFLPLDNDYYFIAQDYSYGVLSCYRPKCILVFGGDLLMAVQADVPELFKAVRPDK